MIRKLVLFAAGVLAVATAGFLAVPRVDGAAERTPVLVELFTSQGCSSCPPADTLLRTLAEQPIEGVEVIPLSWHVDYWNRLGWTDPYSSETATARQQAYARNLNSRGLYTPQMIVDGRAEFVGSDRSRAYDAIRAAGDRKKTRMKLTIEKTNGAIVVRASGSLSDDGNVLLVLAEDNIKTNVKRGENGGRTLQHTAVVRDSVSMTHNESGVWTGTLTVPADSGTLAVVVLAQDSGGRTVAVERAKLAN